MKIKGEIISIQDPQVFESGAKKLTFQIDTKEQYNNIISFELFKGVDHAEHVDKFTQFNHVGDNVEVEFNIKSQEYNGKWYTALSVWKVEKVGSPVPATAEQMGDDTEDSSLPF